MLGDKVCQATTNDGKPCGAAPGPSGYCFVHDPARGEERAAARSSGGHARHVPHSGATAPVMVKDIAGALRLLDYVLEELVVHDNSLLRARALIALAAEYKSMISAGELEERVKAIEQALKMAR